MGSTSVFYTTELRNDLQVQIISHNGDIGIDIRKWCYSSYSKTFPTKHGIRLNPQNWTRFQMSTIIILTSIKSSLEIVDGGHQLHIVALPVNCTYGDCELCKFRYW